MNASELKAGCKAFEEHEVRDAMYKTATFLVGYFWGKPKEMADGLGVLLLTWNQAFYRYGQMNFDALEDCLSRNQQSIEAFRGRDIVSYTPADDEEINRLYNEFLVATQLTDKHSNKRQSPVSVSKALHLLAPAFFPLWDDRIARKYGCHYKYIPFIRKMKEVVQVLGPEVDLRSTGKTLLKLVDEYNYSKFTQKWI